MGKKGDAEENSRRKALKRAQKQQRAQGKPEASASVRTMLKRLGLRIKNVEPDGNCQFRAVADQLYGDPDRYRQVRTTAIAELERGAELYQGFITDDEPWADYVARMRDESEWGDMTTLMALASCLSLRVIVHQNNTELPRYELVPHHGTVRKTIHVLFDASLEHYDSVRAQGDGDDDGQPPKEIQWTGNGAGSEDEDADQLSSDLRDKANIGDHGKGKAKKQSSKPKSKKQMQAEVLAKGAEEARKEELAKTLSV